MRHRDETGNRGTEIVSDLVAKCFLEVALLKCITK